MRLCILTDFVALCCTNESRQKQASKGRRLWLPSQKLSKLDPELLLEFLEPACAGTV